MSSGNFSKKKVQKQGIVKKSRFDLSHDFSTSFNWGEIQPMMCRLLPTASSNIINMANVIRLSAMNVPTFGRVAFKQSWHFVPMEDIFPNYKNLLSGVPQAQTGLASTTDAVIFNTEFPTVTPSLLMSVLCTKDRSSHDSYVREGTDDVDQEWLYQAGVIDNWDRVRSRFPGVPNLQASQVLYTLDDFANNERGYLYNTLGYHSEAMIKYIKPTGADFTVLAHYASKDWMTCYRLSTKGRRLYKLFLDLGYTVDFDSSLKLNMMPLIAFYKAYFDAYCLPQYQNWEMTNAFKLVKYIYELGATSLDLTCSDASLAAYWNGFIEDLSQCWYSENADYVSAHVPLGAGVGYNNLPGATDQLMTQLKYTKSGQQVSAFDQFVSTSAININGVQFSGQYLDQVSDEVLKKLYLSVNTESAVGFNIKDRLIAKGYKAFVDECKSNFIKASTTPITISDVNSTADTMDSAGNGMPLGSYAGKGVQYDEVGSFTYENSEIGYIIGLGTIVPIQSGYPFSLDPTLLGINRYTFYNPQYDSLSYEQTPKACVGHTKEYYCPSISSQSDDNVFGLIPRYSGYKIAQNRLSGCFAFNSERASWMPYTLDRDIVENNDTEFLQNETTEGKFYYSARRDGINIIPTAGSDWRYPTNNSWKGNYNRIFYNEGMIDDGNPNSPYLTRIADESFIPTTDNFLVHSAISYQQWANMLPIAESWDTIDEDAPKPTMEVNS